MALYALKEHPDIYAKLCQEVQDTIGDSSEITFDTIRSMKYVDAVMKEVFRAVLINPNEYRY